MPLVARKFLAMSLPLLSKIHSLFEEAEDALKLYERISLSNLAPALNELRYAGHHILAAEAAEDDAVRDSHARRAVGHCIGCFGPCIHNLWDCVDDKGWLNNHF